MAFDVELPRMLRHMIDDLSDSPTYSDERLTELVILSAQLVNAEVVLDREYNIDLDDMIFSPDPTTNPRDNAFVNLIVLKAGCIIDQAEARKAAGQGIAIQDNRSSIDLRGRATNRLALIKEGWCKAYAQAKFEYQAGMGAMAGHAILSPFRVNDDGGGLLNTFR